MLQTLKHLCALDAPSGYEDAVREELVRRIGNHAEVNVDPLGNILAFKKGAVTSAEKILLDAHMDEVGFLITAYTPDGFLRFAPLGGIDPAVVFGRRVRVCGQIGVIGGIAVHHLNADQRIRPLSMEELLIDIGASCAEEAEQRVPLGSFACFDTPVLSYGDGFLMGKAIDDRAGCAVLLDLIQRDLPCDTWFSFTVQEETGLSGAQCAAYTAAPDIAIAVETTTAADLPGTPSDQTVCELGKGAVALFVDHRTVYDAELYQTVLSVAQKNAIAVQSKRAKAGGNNAGAIHTAGAGVKTAAISLPCRYLHSGSVVAHQNDLFSVRDLVLALLEELAVQ